MKSDKRPDISGRWSMKVEDGAMNHMKKGGFTIIEILVVVSIVSVLAIFGTERVASVQKSGRDAKRISDVQAVVKAMQSAESAGVSLANGNGRCADTGGPYTLCGCIFTPDSPEVQFNFWSLKDPARSAFKVCAPTSAAPCNYSIQGPAPGVAPTVSDFRIYFFLEVGGNGLGRGLHMATPAGIY